MQKSKNAHEEMVDATVNLLLQNLELSSKPPIYIDCMGDGRGVATKLIDDLPLIELTRLEGTRLTISRLLQQRKIARKVMRKSWFYGASLYIKYLCRGWWLRSTQALKSHLK